MKLTVLNGSPRGRKGNTHILLEHFRRGFEETQGNAWECYELNRVNQQPEAARAFGEAEAALMAYPLYTDAMPGLVKAFIELLEPYCGQEGNPRLGFIVQSGFAESHHSSFVARYNEKLARRLGSVYLGTVIKGGVEGIQVQPESWTRPLYESFYRLGQVFGATGQFDAGIMRQLAQPVRLSWRRRSGYRLLALTGLTNFYWDMQLKKNGVFGQRFARPYEER
jgi:hypothetical protein